MSTRTRLGRLAGVVGVASAAAALPHAHASAQDANRCSISVGVVTPDGRQASATFTATQPVTSTPLRTVAGPVFAPGVARLASDAIVEPLVPADAETRGSVVLGDSLYTYAYRYQPTPPSGLTFTRIGSGWGAMKALSVVQYSPLGATEATSHHRTYALAPDGTLYRWEVRAGGYAAKESAPGFSSVRAMAHISQTTTYDTFLVTTDGGALYTVRIPLARPMKPVVKVVRTTGWAAHESLVADGCGRQGTLVAGIDRDTGTVRLYAVGHATGTTTPIVDLGVAPTKLTASPTYLSTVAPFARSPLFGE